MCFLAALLVVGEASCKSCSCVGWRFSSHFLHIEIMRSTHQNGLASRRRTVARVWVVDKHGGEAQDAGGDVKAQDTVLSLPMRKEIE